MTAEETIGCQRIDTLISQNRNFAIWRIPGESPRFIMQSSGSVRFFYNIKELDGQSGYVIAPFHPSGQLPILLIQPDVYSIDDIRPADGSEIENCEIPSDEKTDSGFQTSIADLRLSYLSAFDRFIRPLREKQFGKLVLSRSMTIKRETGFSPAAAFYKACKEYLYSYVYLCHTPQTGTWLGCTPEIILSGENGEWQTVALAGTQPLKDGELPIKWDDKNREEQAIVANYIRTQLNAFGIEPVETAPHPVRAGALAHLKTDFGFSIPGQEKLGDLLQHLHPTPAVCGLPKEESYRFILEKEGYDRRYYSGFIGWLEPEKRSDLYVNLRCMNILRDRFVLYAGGGLLASSAPENEWLETEAKMQTMKRLIL